MNGLGQSPINIPDICVVRMANCLHGRAYGVQVQRPVAFAATDAATWIDPELSGERAAELARSVALRPDRFDWYQVSKAVGNVRNQGPELAAPLARGLFD